MSLSDRRWDAKAAELEFGQLEAVRAQAVSWRNGLGGLTALLAAVVIVKGRDNIGDLGGATKYCVMALLCVAFLALLAGSLLAMTAAFGSPGEDILLTGDELRVWTNAAVRTARRQLDRARVLLVGGVVLVAVATGVTWTAPSPAAKKDAPARIYSVELSVGGTVCGELSGGDTTGLTLQTGKSGKKAPVTIPYSQVKRVGVVSSC
ncbi:hypothetical protein [Actinomadura rupiterrae]|uniref:hypothetical protein n=1 Tax=Actinomadura rupiterrae TaxID=559627 RepID=UPI0020A55F37|nr:hypothetical protein [Actinomadura rupiterrae]MCP2336788.1 hypothetical protein [Actinomadura rupiterrae]